MAKSRIYELAREFNMTNTVLIDKVKEMGISVKSHMSALDDEEVTMVKAELFFMNFTSHLLKESPQSV